jgi:hypothetical protein
MYKHLLDKSEVNEDKDICFFTLMQKQFEELEGFRYRKIIFFMKVYTVTLNITN